MLRFSVVAHRRTAKGDILVARIDGVQITPELMRELVALPVQRAPSFPTPADAPAFREVPDGRTA